MEAMNARKSGRVSAARTCLRAACANLINTTGRDHFAKLARTWIKLAEDLERNRYFLDEDAEPDRRTG